MPPGSVRFNTAGDADPRLTRGVNAGRVLVGEGNLQTEGPGLHWDWKVEIGATTRPNQVDHFSSPTTQKFLADQPPDFL